MVCKKPPGLIKADKPAAAQRIAEVLHQGEKWVLGTRAFQKAKACFCFFSMSQTGAQVLTVRVGDLAEMAAGYVPCVTFYMVELSLENLQSAIGKWSFFNTPT